MVWIIMTIEEYNNRNRNFKVLKEEMIKMQDFLKEQNIRMEEDLKKQEGEFEKLKKEAEK